MKTIEEIQTQLGADSFTYSLHASDLVSEREISRKEVRHTGPNVIIIEDYPDDKYSPSRLLLGLTDSGRPLHILVFREDHNALRAGHR